MTVALFGTVVELVDTPDLKSVDHCDREGSSPSRPINKFEFDFTMPNNKVNPEFPGLSFTLSKVQEKRLEDWLVEQNTIIVKEQLENGDLNETQKEIQKKSLDMGFPIPVYDLNTGYYSISFTPVAWGNRIYVHNHFTGKSFKLFDKEDFEDQTATSGSIDSEKKEE